MFVEKMDYINQVRQLRLEQMSEDITGVFEQTSSEAVAIVRNYLFTLYDVESIFAKMGTDRDTLVLLWCKNIAVFIMHKRLPQAMIPPHVQVCYEDTIRFLEKVAIGKMTVDLPAKKIDTDGDGTTDTNQTVLKWGSNRARSH